jgi:hypothetical protein
MVNRPDEMRHVVAWLPITRWVICILSWVAVAVSWLFPHLDLHLRALAPLGLTAAIWRTIVTVLFRRGRPAPRPLLGLGNHAQLLHADSK